MNELAVKPELSLFSRTDLLLNINDNQSSLQNIEKKEFSVVLEEKAIVSAFNDTGIFVSKTMYSKKDGLESKKSLEDEKVLRGRQENVLGDDSLIGTLAIKLETSKEISIPIEQVSELSTQVSVFKTNDSNFQFDRISNFKKLDGTLQLEKGVNSKNTELFLTNQVLSKSNETTEKSTLKKADRNHNFKSQKEVADRYFILKNMNNFVKVSLVAVAGGLKVNLRVGEIEIDERNDITSAVNEVVNSQKMRVLGVHFDNEQN